MRQGKILCSTLRLPDWHALHGCQSQIIVESYGRLESAEAHKLRSQLDRGEQFLQSKCGVHNLYWPRGSRLGFEASLCSIVVLAK